MRTIAAVVVMAAMVAASSPPAANWSSSLDEAHRLFYSGNYEAAASLALDVRTQNPESLAASELRTSALHFQMRRALGEPKNRENAWKQCSTCQELMPVFMAELAMGQAAARATTPEESRGCRGPLFPGQARPELRVAAARHSRAQDRMERVLGSAEVARYGAQAQPGSCPCPRRPRLDRLHRRHEAPVRHQMDAGRRQQEDRGC